MRNPAASIRYKPACGGAERKSRGCPFATLTISAQSRTKIPAARDANAITVRSLRQVFHDPHLRDQFRKVDRRPDQHQGQRVVRKDGKDPERCND